jgi:hypothetical protein
MYGQFIKECVYYRQPVPIKIYSTKENIQREVDSVINSAHVWVPRGCIGFGIFINFIC